METALFILGTKNNKYEMNVKLVNGKREGRATILNGGLPFIRLEYKCGELTGVVEKVSESGCVVLRGHLVNGVETGLFREYADSVVTWIGYYRNGDRYSSVVESELYKGFYREHVSELIWELPIQVLVFQSEAERDALRPPMEATRSPPVFIIGGTVQLLLAHVRKGPLETGINRL